MFRNDSNKKRSYVAAGLAFILLSAIAATTTITTISLPAFAQEEGAEEVIDFGTNVEFIKGHLEQAIANKKSNQIELAIAHSGHPIEEVFTLIEGPLSEKNSQLSNSLKTDLEALATAASVDSASAFEQKVTAVRAQLDQAIEAVVGENVSDVAYNAGVIAGLLETAELEYGEAVENGEIIEMIEYQDASAFINRARAAFDTIKGEIDQHESEEIAEFFGELDSSVKARADPADVNTLIGGIVHELGEVVPSAGNENAEFAANIEFIRGHLNQAVANKEANNVQLAVAHSTHPIEEVYALLEGEIAEHDAALNTQLKGELAELANQVQSLSAADFKEKVTQISGLLDSALQAVVSPEERSDAKFNAMVAILLLETAEVEYEEAVADGEIIEMIEYQDSTAFIARAQAIFNSVKAELPAHEAEEIEEFFGQLNSLTGSNASFEEVETVIGGIVHEFEEAAGLESGAGGGGAEGNWAYVDRIVELLDQSVAEYKAGNFQKAKALAIEAYLENYEFIESDIEEDDAELMEKIEVDMRQELTAMIDDRRPAAEVESHVDAIKTDLEIARAIVTPEFPVALAVIAATMALLVAMARFKGISLFQSRSY